MPISLNFSGDWWTCAELAELMRITTDAFAVIDALMLQNTLYVRRRIKIQHIEWSSSAKKHYT